MFSLHWQGTSVTQPGYTGPSFVSLGGHKMSLPGLNLACNIAPLALQPRGVDDHELLMDDEDVQSEVEGCQDVHLDRLYSIIVSTGFVLD